ncbi:HPr family phosphocarrier protein [Candidatus Bealeia paramacronuclearis]|uniref:HPr family phosphocarrier protein n=1 Tax=Candidatus Bealeia paramacronuclearis TaxID=1921001 RepID=A0ABZ2C6S8_9PROT|nr:HPr family phosphocarrier protein [Candidatus Bealeia paramacronuclearis]
MKPQPLNLSVEVTIQNRKGLHARPTAKIVKLAESFSSHIELSHNNLNVSAKSIMGILMLGVRYGSTVIIKAEGSDAEIALIEIERLINSKFGED